MTIKPLVIGNWKMNLDFVEAVHLGQQIGVLLKNRPSEHTEIVVAPPFVDLRSVASIVDSERIPIGVAAQHVNPNDNGAHTGEVSASMLKRLGVTWVLVGHSERRSMYAMDDAAVALTLRAVVRSGLKAVLCVGEALDIREDGNHDEWVRRQLRSALDGLDERFAELVTIAYEPIWAIGTGQVATPEQAQEAIAFVRALVADRDREQAQRTRILYGGSVKADNAAELLALPDVDGALVGGASLDAESFAAIIAAVGR
jgi:triosephosphate isomerase